MLAAAPFKGVVALLLALLLGTAHAISVVNEPTATGSSGDYVTLPFQLEGQGEYTYTVQVDAPWQPLNPSGRVRADGPGFVSVTLRVPGAVAGGSRVPVNVHFENVDDAQDATTGTGYVKVLATAAVELLGPRQLDGVIEEPLELELLITNLGNTPDTFTFTADGGMWDVRFETTTVTLAAGEQRVLGVRLELRGDVSSGYRKLFFFTATSTNDPAVAATLVTESVFYARGEAGGATRERVAPRLNLTVSTGVAAGVTFDEDGTHASLSYDVNPRLSGELSDYVRASAGVGRFSGNIVDPFKEVPSRLDLGLSGDTWDASAAIGSGRYSLAGGGLIGDWRISGSGTYATAGSGASEGGGLGFTAHAVSQLPDLDLQFSGATISSTAGRRDDLAANYRTPLGDDLMLSVGAALYGYDTDDGYRLAAGVNESLSYQQQAFDVTQTYSGVPLAGIHNIGLSGGLRSAGPVGVRASTSLQLTPSEHTWRNNLSLTTRIAPGIGAGVTGSYQTGSKGATWSVRPRLSLGYSIDSLRITFGATYAYTGVLWGDAVASSGYTAASSLRYGPVRVDASGRFLLREASANTPAGQLAGVRVSAEFKPGRSTTVTGSYERESDTTKDENTLISAQWTEAWTPTFATRLAYDRRSSLTYSAPQPPPSLSERVTLLAQLSDLGVPGLNMSGGYALSSSQGIFSGGPLKHDFSVRLGYTLRLPFDTPPAIIATFGGRKGGEVRGVLFHDADLDGELGEDEEPLAGVSISMGGATTTTGEDGSYSLRVPSGVYELHFGSGLPASVAPSLAGPIEVAENSAQQMNVPFVPVASVNILLFDDADNDGERSASEGGISFGGVIIEGPITKSVRLSAQGTALVSDLVPGRYTIRPDPQRLPPRFRATTEPVVIQVSAGDKPRAVAVGAGAPPRQVVTTFDASKLAVIARANPTTVVPGEELEVSALVNGPAERVYVRLGDVEVELTGAGSRWTGTIIVPEGTPAGKAELEVVAVGGGGSQSAVVGVRVR